MNKKYTFWLIGLPSSGKTTLAKRVCKEFNLIHLDSDEIRRYLTPNPIFSQNEREIVYRSIILIANILNERGFNVIVSATSNLEKYRKIAMDTISNYREIYIECPVEVCEFRDVKGLYDKSKKGLINTVPIKIVEKNIDYINKNYKDVDIFELPQKYNLLINTADLDLEASVLKLKEYIESVLIFGG